MAHGKKRGSTTGRHKRRRSPETLRWEREFMQLAQPVWLPNDVYRQLIRLREKGA